MNHRCCFSPTPSPQPPAPSPRRARRALRALHGFTLVELITVMVIVGILAAVAGPRFFGASPFAERGYADEIAGALRDAQKVAVATGCPVRVSVDAAGYEARQRAAAANHCSDAGAWSTPVLRADGSQLAGQTPANASVTAATQFVFNAAGRLASAAAPVQVGSYTVTVADNAFVDVQ